MKVKFLAITLGQNDYVTGLYLKIYLMQITTIMAKYFGIGTFFIKEYEYTKKSNRKFILPIVFHIQF